MSSVPLRVTLDSGTGSTENRMVQAPFPDKISPTPMQERDPEKYLGCWGSSNDGFGAGRHLFFDCMTENLDQRHKLFSARLVRGLFLTRRPIVPPSIVFSYLMDRP